MKSQLTLACMVFVLAATAFGFKTFAKPSSDETVSSSVRILLSDDEQEEKGSSFSFSFSSIEDEEELADFMRSFEERIKDLHQNFPRFHGPNTFFQFGPNRDQVQDEDMEQDRAPRFPFPRNFGPGNFGPGNFGPGNFERGLFDDKTFGFGNWPFGDDEDPFSSFFQEDFESLFQGPMNGQKPFDWDQLPQGLNGESRNHFEFKIAPHGKTPFTFKQEGNGDFDRQAFEESWKEWAEENEYQGPMPIIPDAQSWMKDFNFSFPGMQKRSFSFPKPPTLPGFPKKPPTQSGNRKNRIIV